MKQSDFIVMFFLFFLFVSFLYFMKIFGSCGGASVGISACSIFEFVRDFKEIFGWLVAAGVAYVAAMPVWKQISIMQRDNMISSIRYLGEEIAELKRIQSDFDRATGQLSSGLYGHIDGFKEGKWRGNIHDCDNISTIANLALRKIQEIEVTGSYYTHKHRTNYINAIRQLEDRFDDITLPERIDASDGLSDSQIKKIEEEAVQAINDIDIYISKLFSAKREMDESFQSSIGRMNEMIIERKLSLVRDPK